MVEVIDKLVAGELRTLRVVCRHCGGVVELPVAHAGRALADGRSCRLCNRTLLGELFEELAEVLAKLAGLAKHVEVQFVAGITPRAAPSPGG
jgi:hypothetical protein